MRPQDILEKEGFLHIFNWHDDAGVVYPKHAHKDKVVIFVIAGDVTFSFADHTHTVKAGGRFDVPVGLEHSAYVGSNGCDYVVGEMIEGDS